MHCAPRQERECPCDQQGHHIKVLHPATVRIYAPIFRRADRHIKGPKREDAQQMNGAERAKQAYFVDKKRTKRNNGTQGHPKIPHNAMSAPPFAHPQLYGPNDHSAKGRQRVMGNWGCLFK